MEGFTHEQVVIGSSGKSEYRLVPPRRKRYNSTRLPTSYSPRDLQIFLRGLTRQAGRSQQRQVLTVRRHGHSTSHIHIFALAPHFLEFLQSCPSTSC